MLEQLHQTISRNVAEHGQHLMGVFATDKDGGDAFMYTIGNARLGLPELVIVGNYQADVVGYLLNLAGAKMRAQGFIKEGDLDIGGKYPLRVRKASAAAQGQWTIQAGQWLGREDYEVMQLLICDTLGRYPGEGVVEHGYDVALL